MENSQSPISNDSIKDSIKNLWAKYSIFFIFVALILLAAKAISFIQSFLAASSKKDVEKAQEQDVKLKTQEDALNKQADALVQKANDLPSTEQKVDESWNKR